MLFRSVHPGKDAWSGNELRNDHHAQSVDEEQAEQDGQLITSVTTLYYTAQRNLAKFVQWANHVEFIENNQQIMDMLNSAYATISTNIDDLIKTRLLPSMQNIVSGAAVGVLNVVTMAKNLIIGIIVAGTAPMNGPKKGITLVTPMITETRRALGNLKIRQPI